MACKERFCKRVAGSLFLFCDDYSWGIIADAVGILSPDSSDLLLKLHKKNRKVWQKFKFHEKPVDFKGRIGYADFRIKQKKGGRLS